MVGGLKGELLLLKRSTSAWSAEDETKLRELASTRLYLHRIALRLKRSESSIRRRARELWVTVLKTPRNSFRFDATWRQAPPRPDEAPFSVRSNRPSGTF